LGHFEESVKVLKQGLALQSKSEKLNFALAMVHLQWADHYARLKDTSNRLQQIQLAIEANPNEMRSFRPVMEILSLDSEESDVLRSQLLKAVGEGKATALVHLLLGTDAGDRSDNAAAARHLELAFKADENMTIAANNLAWLIAHEQSPDLEKALALVDAALQIDERAAAFHHTRGVILAKMGRWQDAVLELESTLVEKGDIDTRTLLAHCYEQLGLPELAEEQRRIVVALKSSPDPTNSPTRNP
jgi:tetratricopeptide (TPR) repeat protein